MSRNVKISAALLAILVGVIGAAVLMGAGSGDGRRSSETPPVATAGVTTTSPDGVRVVAPDPRRLGRAGTGGVTFTEFLDFECEACGAVYPVIEALRRDYAGRVTFNIRYFPIPSHKNARNAAIAVEAAAQQGKLEGMYRRMFETQTEWAEEDASKAPVFRGYARDLGLDMTAFDAAVADPKTAARIERDVRAGLALGVEGTPTFFLDEERIEPRSPEDLRRQLDAALRGR